MSGFINIVYTVIGYSENYAKCVEFFVKSLLIYTPYPLFDIFVLCDEKLIDQVKHIIRDALVTCTPLQRNTIGEHLRFAPLPHTPTPMRASMQKLRLFDIENVFDYKYALYVDLDIMCLTNLNRLFIAYDDYLLRNPDQKNKLQACPERETVEGHNEIFWSMNNYTKENLAFFSKHNILPFNAGCFLFPLSPAFKNYFREILQMIVDTRSQGKLFFYEQAYMNVYFNTRNLISYDMINCENYVMFPDADTPYTDKIVHFCGSPGQALIKYDMMSAYAQKHNVFIPKNKNKGSYEKRTRVCPSLL